MNDWTDPRLALLILFVLLLAAGVAFVAGVIQGERAVRESLPDPDNPHDVDDMARRMMNHDAEVSGVETWDQSVRHPAVRDGYRDDARFMLQVIQEHVRR